jgi:hypothetical protein
MVEITCDKEIPISTHIDTATGHDAERERIIKAIVTLHAAQRVGEAHQLAAEASAKFVGDIVLFTLLSAIRQELIVGRTNELISDTAQTLRRTAQTQSQALVRDILKDAKYDDPKRLERYGYSVASQNEEDGMLAEIFRRIGETNRIFFEFGVGNGLQNITFHMLLNGWKGWWIEINKPKLAFMRQYFSGAIDDGRLVIDDSHIDAENINAVCEKLGIPEEIDLLSIDIDGNDYHVFDRMSRVHARVLVLEYNPLYPPPMRLVGGYDPNYQYSEQSYIGASLQSLTDLAESKGYQLVGTSISGINAIFVRKDLAGDKFAYPATPMHLYHSARYQLSFTGGFGAGIRANFGPLHTALPPVAACV